MSDTTTTKMQFMTISDFKAKLGISKIDYVINPNTKKLFASTSAGNYKVEQDLKQSEPRRFMYENEDTFVQGCIVNVKEVNNAVFSD